MTEEEIRERAEEFLPVAHKIASYVWLNGGRRRDLDNLKAEAALILVQALPKYDPSRGSLEAFVRARVQLDLLHHVRSTTLLSRGEQEKAKRGERPSVSETSWEAVLLSETPRDEDLTAQRNWIDDFSLQQLLPEARLKLREKLILQRFRNEETIQDIAKHFRITPGRVSQIMTAVYAKLRKVQENPPRVCLVCGNRIRWNTKDRHVREFCTFVCARKFIGCKKRIFTDEETLRRLYVTEELSTEKIAKKYGCHRQAVCEALERFGIPKRPNWQVTSKCIECGAPFYRSRRCRFHYNLLRARYEQNKRDRRRNLTVSAITE